MTDRLNDVTDRADNEVFYDDYWSQAEDQRMLGPVARHQRRLIRSILQGLYYRSVVDVGCGEGTLLRDLFWDRDDLRKVGTDLSPLAVKLAAAKNPGTAFHVLDVSGEALRERFDLEICSEVIEHVPDDEAALRNLVEMTGSYLVITTPGGRMRAHEKDIGHLRNYDPQALKARIEKHGLNVVRMYQWGWPFYSPPYRNLLEKLGGRTRELTEGSFTLMRRVLCWILYVTFLFNRRTKGDQLVLLAERPRTPPSVTPLNTDPFVSIVIAARNAEPFMEQCVNSLNGLDYPRNKYEVIFADGRSTDRTAELARSAGFRVVDNPRLKASAGRNVAFADSKGDIVAFADADCIFDPAWIKNAVRHFQESAVAGVSGPTKVPADQNAFGKAVGLTFELAQLVKMTVHLERVGKVTDIDDLPGCNCFYRREALQAVMPTNTALFASEDVELNASLRSLGFRLAMTPDVEVFHYKRSSPGRFWHQMHTFGAARARLGKRDPTYVKPGHWLAGIGIPVSVLAVLVSGLFYWEVWAVAALAALLLGIALIMYGTARASFAVGLNAPLAFVMLVTGWPIGFLQELLSPKRFPANTHASNS
jgi:GT2 family glycosyltransferase